MKNPDSKFILDPQPYLVEMSYQWIECLKTGIFIGPNSVKYRIFGIEPLVDTGHVRFTFVPADAEWADYGMLGNNMFSRN